MARNIHAAIHETRIAVNIMGLHCSRWPKSKIVANRAGPAMRGIARGMIKGSPAGRLALRLVASGKRILMAIRNMITPEAIRTATSERSRKLNKNSPTVFQKANTPLMLQRQDRHSQGLHIRFFSLRRQ